VAEWTNGEFTLTDDPERVDIDAVERMLRKSYWASKRERRVIEKSFASSFVLSLFHGVEMIAMARVVSDFCTFAWICDVFVEEDFRGRGLSKWMMEVLLSHDAFATSTRWCLATHDAHELYRRFGFIDAQKGRWMTKGFGVLDLCDETA
jgi:GNAT superfamily N-acetyltransferase